MPLETHTVDISVDFEKGDTWRVCLLTELLARNADFECPLRTVSYTQHLFLYVVYYLVVCFLRKRTHCARCIVRTPACWLVLIVRRVCT